ncbi:sigma-70 family RNA polymerase sigma factor [Streptomyces sp. NPDC052644]
MGADDGGELGEAVLRARGGDERAFAQVYRAVQPGLLAYLRTLAGDDAEDVAAEAWREIARDLGRFRGDGADFRGWAAAVARRRALARVRDQDRGRRTAPRRGAREPSAAQPGTAQGPGPSDAPDPTAPAASAAPAAPGAPDVPAAPDVPSADAALDVITALPRDEAEAVLLRLLLGLDAGAAARVLGRPRRAVRAATCRALRNLSRRLEGPVGPP